MRSKWAEARATAELRPSATAARAAGINNVSRAFGTSIMDAFYFRSSGGEFTAGSNSARIGRNALALNHFGNLKESTVGFRGFRHHQATIYRWTKPVTP